MEYKDYLLLKDKIMFEVNRLRKNSLKIALIRFILAVAGILCLLVGYFFNYHYLYFVSLVLWILFTYFVFKHHRVIDQLNYLEAKLLVVKNYLARFANKWNEFEETGIDYVTEITGTMKDLDIVGKNSLFQYLNTAVTLRGKKRLLAKFSRTCFNLDLIVKEQKAIKELSEKEKFVINIETYGKMIEKPKISEQIVEEFIEDINNKQNLSNSYKVMINIVSLLTVVMLFLFCFNIMAKISLLLFVVLVFIQWIIALVFLTKNNLVFKKIANLSKSLNSYYQICSLVLKTDFQSQHLNELKETLTYSSEAFEELKKISSLVKQRNNLLAGLLLNGIFLWDLRCKNIYGLWIKKYARKVDCWLEAIGELESLISLQILLKTKKQTTFASFEPQMCLEFEQAFHPLIAEDKAIANSFKMEKHVCVITGSNMSGKTTFLRTVGLNLVLAFSGGPVMAKKFKCSPMEIYTSMRLEDNINGISTFYAELLRIKEIVEANNQGKNMIALIDEIFKGTNSKDRIYGAVETIKQLSSANIFTFITTHDFELCELENQIACCNYHFSEDYQDDKIIFDYLIKKGRCKTTNAKYLLQMVGITKS